MNKKLKVALICGGPSMERGISLNSARSAMDHLEFLEIEMIFIYFDAKCHAFQISKVELYSNTPSDFDFKLSQTALPLSERSLIKLLKSVDIVFPVIHGTFGEDGQIQTFLEKEKIPFVGSGSKACQKAFDKFSANQWIQKEGFFALPSILLEKKEKNKKEKLFTFFKKYGIERAIVKPANGGSSIGVFSVASVSEALEKAELIFSKYGDFRVVVESFASGIEFTLIILENRFGLPVALPPTEIETDYSQHQIFDFRKKYLPTRQVTWHCPPRFDDETIEKIQAGAEQIFALFQMKDFGRFDGWVLPNGKIWFCDFNPISGMEQNSFLFQQAARIGMTHSDVLLHILKNSCIRQKIFFPEINKNRFSSKRKKVHVLMGGKNSERQVSLMSGTNIWLKLRRSENYQPEPFLLDAYDRVWQLPYHLCLNHTVEEITENCQNYEKAKDRLSSFEKRARLRLGLIENKNENEFFKPKVWTLDQFLKHSPFVFIALHGGEGENGILQQKLQNQKIKFNGPESKASELCMDKWATSCSIKNLKILGVDSIPGKVLRSDDLFQYSSQEIAKFWKKTLLELKAKTLIIKPRADGCTTGIVHLFSAKDLEIYLNFAKEQGCSIPKNSFKGQLDIIEMPTEIPEYFLLEKFIETDLLKVIGNRLHYEKKTGFLEITIGVLEGFGKMKALNPSLTVVEGEVLSVEEKFQGGTGINITPPPETIMKPKILKKVKERIGILAQKIKLKGYSRIDAFVNVLNGDLLIIEINTLPGLTPSTVFYHQGISESPSLFPKNLLEVLIQNKGY